MTLDNRLRPCPICGAKAFVSRDVVDGFEFGWSVGCPRACIKDGIHGFDDYDSFQNARLTMFYLNSKEQAIEEWNKRCREEGERVDDNNNPTDMVRHCSDYMAGNLCGRNDSAIFQG